MSRGHRTGNGFTADQHRFAGLIAEGHSQSDAFREVWPHARSWKPASVHTAASRMAAKVAPRVSELLHQADAETGINVGQLIEDLKEMRLVALDRGDLGNAIRVVGLLYNLARYVET